MTGRTLNDQDIDLLKFNYENLHGSVWECHKASWIVTSIFIPIIFAMQGYFIRDYFSALNTSTTGISIFHVFMGAVVIQSLAFVWWLIMRIFSKYNKSRMDRLKEIESIININNIGPIKQYKLHYTLYFMLNQDKLVNWIKHRKYFFSWDNVSGNDNKTLMRCLRDDYDIVWGKSVEIHKSNDGRTYEIVKKKNGKLKIYECLEKNYSRIKITFNRVCDFILVETVIMNLLLLAHSICLIYDVHLM